MNAIQRIQPEEVFALPGLHAGVRVGELVGVGDFRAQAEQVFENLGAVLAERGSGFDRIMKLSAFFVDISRDLQVYREVRDQYIAAEHAPASTAVQVAKLFHPSVWIEVEAVAACAP
ncbi:RidA family protein [Dyella flagellata]|uniref:Enamine deaminase RidA, house cleaning of reactive enamine intermediates, YjgF/YER057c/UK114 family n=1 Tax=Dyella flagellata TaxID=1867833 RepID=A0ABQ5XE38_9GAMM|nr:RidA family protein [Dyella flagellata]GLQ89484.1 hypothetical protein GCM10007898_30580 [Dyella flagellata]